MQATGSVALAAELWDTILENTMYPCLNKTTNLIDFSTGCSRTPHGDPYYSGTVRDITDWPEDARGGCVLVTSESAWVFGL